MKLAEGRKAEEAGNWSPRMAKAERWAALMLELEHRAPALHDQILALAVRAGRRG